MVVLAEDAAKIQKVVDGYQAAHPDVTIKLQPTPWDQYFQTAELRLSSKDKSVDLVYVDVPLIASYASRGFLASRPRPRHERTRHFFRQCGKV